MPKANQTAHFTLQWGDATWYTRVRCMKNGLKRRCLWLASHLRKGPVEGTAYIFFAGALVLLAACWFYSSMRLQTLYSEAWSKEHYRQWIELGVEPSQGPWSAPLDDVFIHFDFARSVARGRPFEWSAGNGYSSGDTSLLYPFVLAVGYLLGFQANLMYFAAIVACVSLFAALLAARSLFRSLPRWTSYLAPVALLGVGALDWSFFSGMEVAFFIGLWASAWVIWDNIGQSSSREGPVPWSSLGCLGVSGALLVATRPEAVTTVAVLGVSLLWLLRTKLNLGRSAALLVLVGGPGALVVLGQTLANYLFTGETAAAGAIAKLELYHPYLSAAEVWAKWWDNVVYQVLRVTDQHFSEAPGVGWLVWILGAVPLVPRATRRSACLLWASLICWGLMVGLNGQVRWQNERYMMPAVAWLLLLAAVGLGVILDLGVRGLLEQRRSWVFLGGLGVVASVVLGVFQAPRFRDQVWFFGRASRNIWDQHVAVGRALAEEKHKPRRVLVGDAGAIPYFADLPALDIIGLGGYSNLPFARATRYGVGAALELIERLPLRDQPDLLAIYPSWWGDFPLWFGTEFKEFPVRGNVIAGGASKVLYVPDWSPLWLSSQPNRLTSRERVVDTLDFADLMSEKAHSLPLPARGTGYVSMKILTYPGGRRQPVWDAGRIARAQTSMRFDLSGLTPGRAARLLLRSAPTRSEKFRVSVNGKQLSTTPIPPSDYWQEVEVLIPPELSESTLRTELDSETDGTIWYHLWLLQ